MIQCCRFCNSQLKTKFADLGNTPLANAYLNSNDLLHSEQNHPLLAYVCEQCLLVQLDTTVDPNLLFSEYAYYSSFSDSWLEHSRRYAEMIIERLSLNELSHVIEIASNDGYLLKNFIDKNIPVLGIEAAMNIAATAKANDIPTLNAFFSAQLADTMQDNCADLVIANNVLAHVPDINDFILGLKKILADDGVINIEVPHLLQLITQHQFDTIYHEHIFYFTLKSLQTIFAAHHLKVFDVESLSTHGGSIRIYICHEQSKVHQPSVNIEKILSQEQLAGLHDVAQYTKFQESIYQIKNDLLSFLIESKNAKRSIAAYGAPAKGNTLFNYCGIRSDLIPYTVDRSPYKQKHFLPGTRIPIYSLEHLQQDRPDYILILPWNIKHEIIAQLDEINVWGGQYVIAIPRLEIIK